MRASAAGGLALPEPARWRWKTSLLSDRERLTFDPDRREIERAKGMTARAIAEL